MNRRLFACLGAGSLALAFFLVPLSEAGAKPPAGLGNAVRSFLGGDYYDPYYYGSGYDPYRGYYGSWYGPDYYRYGWDEGPRYYGYYDDTPSYSSPLRSSAVDGNAVLVNVKVPPQAEILFGGEKTSQRGSFRQFVTPSLTPGREYAYEIQARWKEGDREVDRTRKITVHAGDRLTVDFTKPEAEYLRNPLPKTEPTGP